MHPDEDIWQTRERLPVEQSWDHVHDGRTDRVRVGLGAYWPEVHVRIRPHGSDVEVRGTFSPTGRLREVEFVALADHAEVGTADLRWSGAIRALREWEAVGREITSQILAGRTPAETVIDARTPTEALRILSQSAQRRPAAIRRGPAFEQLLRDIAEDYRQAVNEGDPRPRVSLAAKYGYSVAHVGWLLTQARKPRNGRPPLLGPAHPGRAGEEPEVQQPIVAAIVVTDRGVLVGRRNDGKPPWTFIAGESRARRAAGGCRGPRGQGRDRPARSAPGRSSASGTHPKTGRHDDLPGRRAGPRH